MTRPSLAAHDKRIALLEQAASHDAAHDNAVLAALGDIRAEIASLRRDMKAEVEKVTDRQTSIENAWSKVQGTVGGIKIGWAMAFTFIGSAVAVAAGQIMGIFK